MPDKLKFFIFAYWHDKGWKRFVGATVKIWDLAHNLAESGHPVVLFLPKYDFPGKNIPFRLVQIPILDFPFLRALSFNFFLTIYLLKYFFAPKPDVVYIRRGISLIPALFAKLRKSIFFYEINDDPYRDNNSTLNPVTRFDARTALKTDEVSLSLCDAAFVITKEIKEKIIKSLPEINRGKLHIMPSGANTDLYRPLDKKECRLRLNLDPSNKYIGFMGTLLEHQGVDVLIDAAPSVINRFPNAVFVIIGEGPMKDVWKKRAEEKLLANRFFFTGQVAYEETPIWINAMDVCTAPFLKRAGLRSPVKVFDYLACAKPVVASKIPGTTDIFDGSYVVRLIEPEDRKALADAIVDILNDHEKANMMGTKGRQLVEMHYDRKVMAKKIINELYSLQKARE